MLLDGLGHKYGWAVLCGILLYVMDKNSVSHLKRGRGEKVIVSSWSAYQSKTPRLYKSERLNESILCE